MSNTSPVNDIRAIDSENSLITLLHSIPSLAVEPPSLYIDLEGNALGRHGSISILSLTSLLSKYLIDIHSLKEAAFSATTTSGTSLKAIPTSPTIPKAAFDIRNDSDALFSLFKVSVDGIKDLRFMELATRKGSRIFVSSLAKCIEKDGPICAAAKAEWSLAKERGLRLLDPKKQGRYEVFDERPLKPEIVQYCQQDVAVLPALYEVYNTTLRQTGQAFWRVRIRGETENRIKLSQSRRYNGKLEIMAAHGWDNQQVKRWIDSWNDDILMEHFLGTSVLNENYKWVDALRSGIDDYLDYLENLDEDWVE